ncbi:nicotinate-nucleotide adenylyltransferase [Alteromonas sp. CYL-A6]|uniref:nicotinate-nucleotide adenylyltransferase n=1 Tax=Alteromonas nitratireducens TaxID=3390813 RepID=UPI0034B7C3A6
MQDVIALLGGTFNPPHKGHIESALDVMTHLGLSAMGLMPCKLPPHKSAGGVSEHHRVAMVKLVCQAHPSLYPELVELSLPSPSYTVKTLQHLRQQNTDRPILFVIGQDSLDTLDSWYEWEQITDYCHLVVMRRDSQTGPHTAALARWIEERRCHDPAVLRTTRSGALYMVPTRLHPASSTAVRGQVAADNATDASQWLEPDIINYIKQHQLYVK